MILCVDMDGVLAVWNRWAGVKEYTDPAYFLALPPICEGVDSVRLLADAGLDVRIESTVGGERACEIAAAKLEWLRRAGLGDIQAIFPPCGTDKYLAAEAAFHPSGADMVLLDDYTKNLVSWSGHGGKAVKFLHGDNGFGGKWQGARVRASEGAHAIARAVLTAAGSGSAMPVAAEKRLSRQAAPGTLLTYDRPGMAC